ncbi:hypothetical protein [Desulforamulus aquiferis]|uniref:Uncharacterized protein n=1 Tax=Desulforamulus aquiferis TaxID=1397668 RepID=A0AAW7ZCG5_9FIRM|nr:hypothetical protein [Desulforamulus aquiferis]MDO7786973.1 hypothetical protein [Desulforamulus aquiferis]RYD03878.1 hypothetical protein N752_17505 [Desulforamulus aquiferis]
MSDIAELINESMEKKGSLEFTIDQGDLWKGDIKEYTVFYKINGDSRIKLFRNNKMELVLVRLNDDWMRQAKVNIAGLSGPLEVRLNWDDATSDEIAIKSSGQSDFQSVKAVQIDN